MSYLKDPARIYAASFAAIRREVDLSAFPGNLHTVILRLVHAAAMPDLTDDLAYSGDAPGAAREALGAGAAILIDATMLGAGIMTNRLPAGVQVVCTLRDPQTPELAEKLQTTRSAAAVELWRDHLEGAVIAIGNAPTTLFHLLEMLEEPDCPQPAALFAFPVGFIGAAKSKQALIDSGTSVPYLTIKGRQGGSAYGAAAINALLVGEGGA
jgi:precorrin-8X/cobalt-precorrin-8 methylmutase